MEKKIDMLEKYKSVAFKYEAEMMKRDDVIGVMQLGGIARNRADQYSDIDNPEQVLERWAKYINWRYFDKKDRVVIKEKVAQKKFNLSSFGEYVQLFTLTINRIKLCAFVVATRKDKNCNTSSES